VFLTPKALEENYEVKMSLHPYCMEIENSEYAQDDVPLKLGEDGELMMYARASLLLMLDFMNV
jgi:hypothetical protein